MPRSAQTHQPYPSLLQLLLLLLLLQLLLLMMHI
jgi:hypothetical protein